jgi:hypothetical protein
MIDAQRLEPGHRCICVQSFNEFAGHHVKGSAARGFLLKRAALVSMPLTSFADVELKAQCCQLCGSILSLLPAGILAGNHMIDTECSFFAEDVTVNSMLPQRLVSYDGIGFYVKGAGMEKVIDSGLHR